MALKIGQAFQQLLNGVQPVKNPILTPPPKDLTPSYNQLMAANDKYKGQMPSMNLDGTPHNLPQGTAVFQEPGALVLKNPNPGPWHFDPLNTPGHRRQNSQYFMLPYNMDSVPKPLPYMERIR